MSLPLAQSLPTSAAIPAAVANPTDLRSYALYGAVGALAGATLGVALSCIPALRLTMLGGGVLGAIGGVLAGLVSTHRAQSGFDAGITNAVASLAALPPTAGLNDAIDTAASASGLDPRSKRGHLARPRQR